MEQSNQAAERSAHVTRGNTTAPSEWPVIQMPDGTWKLKAVVALEARIAELEAAMKKAKRHFEANEPLQAFIEICATLVGGKDE